MPIFSSLCIPICEYHQPKPNSNKMKSRYILILQKAVKKKNVILRKTRSRDFRAYEKFNAAKMMWNKRVDGLSYDIVNLLLSSASSQNNCECAVHQYVTKYRRTTMALCFVRRCPWEYHWVGKVLYSTFLCLQQIFHFPLISYFFHFSRRISGLCYSSAAPGSAPSLFSLLQRLGFSLVTEFFHVPIVFNYRWRNERNFNLIFNFCRVTTIWKTKLYVPVFRRWKSGVKDGVDVDKKAETSFWRNVFHQRQSWFIFGLTISRYNNYHFRGCVYILSHFPLFQAFPVSENKRRNVAC